MINKENLADYLQTQNTLEKHAEQIFYLLATRFPKFCCSTVDDPIAEQRFFIKEIKNIEEHEKSIIDGFSETFSWKKEDYLFNGKYYEVVKRVVWFHDYDYDEFGFPIIYLLNDKKDVRIELDKICKKLEKYKAEEREKQLSLMRTIVNETEISQLKAYIEKYPDLAKQYLDERTNS